MGMSGERSHGSTVAVTLRAEIGDIVRFRRGPELACYAGLVPRADRSADRVYHGRITRDGSPWLRWALVEAAMHAIKRQDAVGRWHRDTHLIREELRRASGRASGG
jgi:transposase